MLLEKFYLALLGQLPVIKWYFVSVAVFFVLERIFPAEKGQPIKGILFSLLLSVAYFATVPFVVALPTEYILNPVTKAFSTPLISLDLTERMNSAPVGWIARNIFLPFLPFLIFDFFYYWMHRLQHTIPFMWRQHKLHHSEENLCAATTSRHHWLEEAFRIFIIAIPMGIALKITYGTAGVIAPILGYWGIFIHSNLRLPLGPLTPVLGGPQYHRIHHSIKPKHYNKNYAAFFPIWDIIFGTYYRPKNGEWPKTGLVGERVTSLWQAMALPFLPQKTKGQGILAESAKMSDASQA